MASTTPGESRATSARPLTGRVALVTGGTRGIGAAITRSLVEQGAAVAAGFSSNRDMAQGLQDELEHEGGQNQGNVGDCEDCQRVVAECIDRYGRLDILVNNAGVTLDRPVWK
jgi:acetoacetyl-CoA reductase